MEEVIDLDNLDGGDQRSVNFGGGLEFLMNDKKRSSTIKSQIDLAELDNLENELNGLSGEGASENISFNFGGGGSAAARSSSFDFKDDFDTQPNLSSTFENTKTWDGFGKLNMDAELPPEPMHSSSAGLSSNEKRRKKRAMLKKINEWCEKGIIHTNPNFTMNTPFEEIEDEYESCLEDKRKKDSVKMYGWWFMAGVNTIEYVNSAYNPFDLNLDGWGEQINDDLDSYEEIFAELYEKYKGGKMAPELSLILRLGCSAAMVNFTNKALSAATPGFNDIIRQSPELMKAFTNATVNTMSQQNPSVGFMNNILNSEPQPNMSYGRPPASVETQGPRSAPPPHRPGQMNYTSNLGSSRPDLAAAKPPMFREAGVSLNTHERADLPEKTPIRKNISSTPMQPQSRPEMEGPNISDSGLDEILSNLKTKSSNVDILKPEEDSMVSISSLKEIQSNTTLPKTSRRRAGNKGSRNSAPEKIVSLDI